MRGLIAGGAASLGLILTPAGSTAEPGPVAAQQPMVACPTVDLRSLTPVQAAAFKQALAATCRVITSPRFRAAVLAHPWLAGCRAVAGGEDVMTGAEVYRRYAARAGTITIDLGSPSNAVAVTNIWKSRILFRATLLDPWLGPDSPKRGNLVDSLAHEMTHLVWNDTHKGYRFTDRGHGTGKCTNARLVSYGLGNTARALWLGMRAGG